MSYACVFVPSSSRSYCHPTQPKCMKKDLKNKLLLVFLAFVRIFLYLCKKIGNYIHVDI